MLLLGYFVSVAPMAIYMFPNQILILLITMDVDNRDCKSFLYISGT